MAITIISNTLLRPFPSPSAESIHSSSPKAPFIVFDKAATNENVGLLHAFRPPLPSNEVLKQALAKVLTYYPHLAGRVSKDEKGQSCILLNNAGVRVIEAYVPSTLAAFQPFDPSTSISCLHPSLEITDEVFQVQLTRYACGGLVLGHCTNHCVADGQSMSFFFLSWSRFVRGLAMDAIPNHDRASILVPRNPPRVEFDHRLDFDHVLDTPVSSFSVETLITSFSTKFINTIKQKMAEESPSSNQKYSRFECLVTHVWKKVTEARALELETISKLYIPVNCRPRAIPPVPVEYFGNLVLTAYPTLSVREILMESYAYVARAVHESIIKYDNDYIQSFTDFGELCKTKGEELDFSSTPPTLSPDFEAESWVRFNFHDLDFGSGPCVLFFPIIPVEGVSVFLPSMKDQEDGIDVIMALLPNHAQIFKKISHSLEKM